MNNDTIAATYIQHEGKWWNVSTINRESSAMEGSHMIYSETMVWTWNPKTRERGDWVGQYAGSKGSATEHFRVCQGLLEGGADFLKEAI